MEARGILRRVRLNATLARIGLRVAREYRISGKLPSTLAELNLPKELLQRDEAAGLSADYARAKHGPGFTISYEQFRPGSSPYRDTVKPTPLRFEVDFSLE